MVAHPGLPQIRTCPIRASGSSRRGFAVPLHYPRSLREPGAEAQSPRPVARPQLRDEPPPSLDRVPAVEVPRLRQYYEVVRLLAVLPAALRCLRLAVPRGAPVLRSRSAPDARPTGPGSLGSATPQRPLGTGGDDEISQVPGDPCCACALFLDPGEPGLPGRYSRSTRPHAQRTTGALHER